MWLRGLLAGRAAGGWAGLPDGELRAFLVFVASVVPSMLLGLAVRCCALCSWPMLGAVLFACMCLVLIRRI